MVSAIVLPPLPLPKHKNAWLKSSKRLRGRCNNQNVTCSTVPTNYHSQSQLKTHNIDFFMQFSTQSLNYPPKIYLNTNFFPPIPFLLTHFYFASSAPPDQTIYGYKYNARCFLIFSLLVHFSNNSRYRWY